MSICKAGIKAQGVQWPPRRRGGVQSHQGHCGQGPGPRAHPEPLAPPSALLTSGLGRRLGGLPSALPHLLTPRSSFPRHDNPRRPPNAGGVPLGGRLW